MDLKQCRDEIDAVDARIVELLNRRNEIVDEVARYKAEHNLPVMQDGRHREVLEHVARLSAPGTEKDVVRIFELIMEQSRARQQKHQA